MNAETEQPFDEFAKIELFGHQLIVARVTKAPIGDFVRCDVIDGEGAVVFTKLVNPKAIYALNLISRDVALALAKARAAEPPVSRYELPAPPPVNRIEFEDDDHTQHGP